MRFISFFGLKNILFFSRKLTLPLFLPSRVTLYYAAICIVSSSCPRVDLHILAAVYERISNRVPFFFVSQSRGLFLLGPTDLSIGNSNPTDKWDS